MRSNGNVRMQFKSEIQPPDLDDNIRGYVYFIIVRMSDYALQVKLASCLSEVCME